jgi:hypothetical protein
VIAHVETFSCYIDVCTHTHGTCIVKEILLHVGRYGKTAGMGENRLLRIAQIINLQGRQQEEDGNADKRILKMVQACICLH